MQHSPCFTLSLCNDRTPSNTGAVHFLRLPGPSDSSSFTRAFVRGHYNSRIASQDLPAKERDEKQLDIISYLWDLDGRKRNIFRTVSGALFGERALTNSHYFRSLIIWLNDLT